MTKPKIGKGNAPGSLEQLNKPLPNGYETRVFRVSAPANVIRWLNLDGKKDAAAIRGRILEAAMKAGIDGSSVTQDSHEEGYDD